MDMLMILYYHKLQQGKEVANYWWCKRQWCCIYITNVWLFMSYFQAMETPVIYKHRVAVGLGVENFLGVPFLSLDTHAAVQLEEDKCFGLDKQESCCTSKVIWSSYWYSSWWLV